MESSENIQVALRFRPLNKREDKERDRNIWSTTKTSISLKRTYIDKLLDEKKM
jgi:hypothetical protein